MVGPLSPRVRGLLAAAFVLMAGDVAYAQGYAVRAGINVNPDQSSFGGQYELGPIVDGVWLQPNVDVGFGNSTTLFAMNMDAVFCQSLGSRSPWMAFAGGGPAINIYRFAAYSQFEPGVNVVGGLSHDNGLFMEFRIGFIESPRFRLGIGYAFHPKTGTASPRPRTSGRR